MLFDHCHLYALLNHTTLGNADQLCESKSTYYGFMTTTFITTYCVFNNSYIRSTQQL